MTSEVTQADRDAARKFVRQAWHLFWPNDYARAMQDADDIAAGRNDNWLIVESFARHRLTAQSGEGQGWIVGNGNGTKWRTWSSVGPEWTEDREQATRYARRVDAERVHAEDEDAWQIVPQSGEGRSGAGEDAGPFHVSQSGDGKNLWFSARDPASGVTIPARDRTDARNLVSSLNRACATFAALNARQSGEGERGQ